MEFSRQQYWSGLPFPSLRIFPTQGSNLGLPYCRQILYCLSHQESPLIIYTDVFFVYSHCKFCVNWRHSIMKSGYNFTVLMKKFIFIIYIYIYTHRQENIYDSKYFLLYWIILFVSSFLIPLVPSPFTPTAPEDSISVWENPKWYVFCCKFDIKTTWQEATSPWCRS